MKYTLTLTQADKEKYEAREQNRQWAIRIKEKRDSEKYCLDKMSPNDASYEWQRGRWSALCDLLNSEFAPNLLKEIDRF